MWEQSANKMNPNNNQRNLNEDFDGAAAENQAQDDDGSQADGSNIVPQDPLVRVNPPTEKQGQKQACSQESYYNEDDVKTWRRRVERRDDALSEVNIKMIKSTQFLELEGKGKEAVVQELFREGVKGLQHLMHLSISECETPEYLANTMDCVPHTANTIVAPPLPVFPILESLELNYLPNLKRICHGQFPADSFGKLKHLEIANCERMEEVIIWKERGEDDDATTTNKIEFPTLETMTLINLSRLIGFCRWIDKIEFPKLKKLHLCGLPQLKWLFPNCSNSSSDLVENNNAAFSSLFPHKVSFPSLEKLRVSDCGSVRTLFHPSMPRYLVNLQELIIDKCWMMEEVVRKEEDDKIGNEMKDGTLFPKLSYLELNDLPVLRSFCHATLDWELPLLESISVFDCPKMKNLAPGFLRTPKLQVLWLKWWAPDGGVEGFWTNDLNNTMLHLYERRKRTQLPDAAGLTDLSFPTSSTSPSTSLRSWRRLLSWMRLRSLMRF